MLWFWQPKKTTDTQSNSNAPDPQSPTTLDTLTSPIYITTVASLLTLFGLSYVYRTHLIRIPNAASLPSTYLHKSLPTHPRGLHGTVVSVGDGDGLRLFHTPGGALAGWGWLRRIPKAPFPRMIYTKPVGSGKGDKGAGKPEGESWMAANTISIRLSGIDAPEKAHFGHPAQRYGDQAHGALKGLVEGRRVTVFCHAKDRYGRVIGTPLARRLAMVPLPRRWERDVGLEMVRMGWANVYEGFSESEFGGKEREAVLRAAEKKAKAAGIGVWGGADGGEDEVWFKKAWAWVSGRRKKTKVESPRAFKLRMKEADQAEKGVKK